MKYMIPALLILLGACANYDSELEAQLESKRDFYAHQQYLEDLYTNYDPEYIDDCLYYEELVCEFE